MTKVSLYVADGTKKQAVAFPPTLQEKENLPLLAQALRVYEAAKHPGLSKVKKRGDVALSTRKIYRQKGTGRARHGAASAPIFVGGGVTHGPRGVKRKLSLPKKMRKKALKVAFSLKANEGRVIFLEGFSKLTKTKQAQELLKKISDSEKVLTGKLRYTFAISNKNSGVKRILKNIKNVKVEDFRDLNAHSVYFGGVLIVDKDALSETSKDKEKDKIEEKDSKVKEKDTKKK